MSRVFITSETGSSARMTLPPPELDHYDVMDVEIMSVDGLAAMIEVERICVQHEDEQFSWSWEATTCWAI